MCGKGLVLRQIMWSASVGVRGEEEENKEQGDHVMVVSAKKGCATADGQQQKQPPAKAPPTLWPPPTLQDLPAGLRALIARSDPSERWWLGVRYDGEHRKVDLWKRTGIETSYMVGMFG